MNSNALPPALLHAIHALDKFQAKQSELYFLRNVTMRIDSKNGKVEALTRSEDAGISVRVLQDGKMGFSFTTSLENAAIDRAIKTAFQVSLLMPPDENRALCSIQDWKYRGSTSEVDAEGLSCPIQEKIYLSQQLESICRSADSRITGVRTASITEYFSEIYFVDTYRKFLQEQSSLFTASITCKAESAQEAQVGSEYSFSHCLKNLDIKTVGKLAAQWATELLGASPAPTLRCPAVLRNSLVAELLEFLAPSFSAEEMDKGRSPLAHLVKGTANDTIFSRHVTLINDGLLKGGFSTQAFDGEGIPSQKTFLVEEGIFKNALYDLYYAKKFKKNPTGSSQRSIKAPPKTGTSNFYMQAGPQTESALLDGIDRGILLTELMGLHTANPVTGDFSLGASGLLIERGKCTQPLRGFAVAGNIFELFRNITDVANDLKFFGSVGAPSVRVSEISVSGA